MAPRGLGGRGGVEVLEELGSGHLLSYLVVHRGHWLGPRSILLLRGRGLAIDLLFLRRQLSLGLLVTADQPGDGLPEPLAEAGAPVQAGVPGQCLGDVILLVVAPEGSGQRARLVEGVQALAVLLPGLPILSRRDLPALGLFSAHEDAT